VYIVRLPQLIATADGSTCHAVIKATLDTSRISSSTDFKWTPARHSSARRICLGRHQLLYKYAAIGKKLRHCRESHTEVTGVKKLPRLKILAMHGNLPSCGFAPAMIASSAGDRSGITRQHHAPGVTNHSPSV